MSTVSPESWQLAAAALGSGGLAVVPTDTLYGLVGPARQPAAVERIYALRQRDADKPLITLIADITDLEQFGLRPSGRAQELLDQVWPGPVSAILACTKPELSYLHRGSGGLSFRLPAREDLRVWLRQTGPLVAPSANPQGQPPATTVAEAQAYFGDAVAAYVDGGELPGHPSALVDLRGDRPRILRTAPGFRLSD
jgi:L-threonylcarbamoyladenylate synthase